MLNITHHPDDYHSDHRAVSKLVVDASFSAGLAYYVTELPAVEVTPSIYFMDTLAGIDVYIGDGATMRRSLTRARDGTLIGHASIAAQLAWCAAAKLRRAIFTHCGTPTVRAFEKDDVATAKRTFGQVLELEDLVFGCALRDSGSTPIVTPIKDSFVLWRSACYMLGVAVIFVALSSPIDVASNRLLSMHMLQHVMLATVAPPLIV